MTTLSVRGLFRRFLRELDAPDPPASRRRRRRAVVVAIAGVFALIAAVDLATRADVSFLSFYFLPVLLAAWYLGPREGIFVSIASVAVFVADDLVAERRYSHAMVPLWNHGAEFVFFVFFSWLIGKLHAAFEREAAARTERFEHDLVIASEVQTALLPPRRLEGATFSAAAECRQAFGVGGDAWDVVALSEDSVFVTVADVSGKGMSAALLMAGFLGSVRGLLRSGSARLDTLAAELSESLRTASADTKFVTAFLAIAEDGILRFVNAGHEAGLLLPPRGETARPLLLPSTGPVLGLLPGAQYREARVDFPAGSSLVLYTDGLTECEDPAGAELGRGQVALLAACLAGETPDRIVADLLDAAEEHAMGAPLGDDITVLCLQRRGQVRII